MYPTAFKDPRGGHNRSQINQSFFKKWTPQMAYVLGDSNHKLYKIKAQMQLYPGNKGYMSDGCIYLIKRKYPRIVFTSGSNQFLEGLSTTLSTCLQIPVKRTYCQLKESNNLCYQLQYNTKISRKILEFMYKDLQKAPYLERKLTIYQNYLINQQ